MDRSSRQRLFTTSSGLLFVLAVIFGLAVGATGLVHHHVEDGHLGTHFHGHLGAHRHDGEPESPGSPSPAEDSGEPAGAYLAAGASLFTVEAERPLLAAPLPAGVRFVGASRLPGPGFDHPPTQPRAPPA